MAAALGRGVMSEAQDTGLLTSATCNYLLGSSNILGHYCPHLSEEAAEAQRKVACTSAASSSVPSSGQLWGLHWSLP